MSYVLVLSIGAAIFVNESAHAVNAIGQTYPCESEIIEIETSQDEALTIEAIRRNGRVCPELCKQLVDYRNSLCKVTDEQDTSGASVVWS